MGHEPLTMAIDHQVKFFKHGDTQENLFSEYHRKYCRFPSENFYHNCFRHTDFFDVASGVFRLGTSNPKKSETICHNWRNSRSRCASVNERFSLITGRRLGTRRRMRLSPLPIGCLALCEKKDHEKQTVLYSCPNPGLFL